MFIYNLTQYVTDSYVLRLRAQNGMWVTFQNFGLKMMMKSGPEKIFLKFLHADNEMS